MPSAASSVRIRSFKYSRSSSGRTSPHVLPQREPRRGGRMAQRGGGPAAQMRRRTSGRLLASSVPSGTTARPARPAATRRRGIGCPVRIALRRPRRADPRRQQRRRRRRKDAERDLRQSERPPTRAAKMKSHASASSKPPPRHRPRTIAAVTAGNSSSSSISACISGSTRPISPGACSGMLAPKLKSAPGAFDREQLQMRILRRASRAPAPARRSSRR